MASALLHCALTGRPVIAQPAVFQRNTARRVQVCARQRPMIWYPNSEPPEHLDGNTPGDFGFDPLRLGTTKPRFEWFKEGELTNGRWAMLAVAGILFTEFFGIAQPWWDLGNKPLLPPPILLLLGVVLFGSGEAARFRNYQKHGGGESGFLNQVPFDPLGMKNDDMREKEIKNGRLAMVAFVGFSSQAAVQGKGPIASLKYHLADPFHHNIFTSKVGNEFAVAVVALALYPLLIEATKNTQGHDKVKV
ncbi:TPA: Photosystem I chlorophyll a/b-binding protein 5, chloroplastic [Trebouxia sp. C0005]